MNLITHRPLKDASDLKNYLTTLYSSSAQYDRPPKYPVTVVCRGIDGGANGTDILGRIFTGIVSYYGKNKECYDLGDFFSTETLSGWDWQVMHLHLSIFFPSNLINFTASTIAKLDCN